MKTIRVKTPAKINLTLEVMDTRDDGFHNIQSVMQAISLYDFIDISIENAEGTEINISGNSQEIPYDQSNLAYIAAEKFLKEVNKNYKINVHIKKNIPVKAGLAGGSSNAAGVLYGLNKLLSNPLNSKQLLAIASEIGSDVSFCLFGGTQIATSRGEVLKKIETPELKILGIKPKKLAISAKEAYDKFDEFNLSAHSNASFKMLMAINKNQPIHQLLYNDLEFPIIREYPQIKQLKDYMSSLGCTSTLMSGSGPTVFGIIKKDIKPPQNLNADCFIAETISHGIRVV